MKRRDFNTRLLLSAFAAGLGSGTAYATNPAGTPSPRPAVKRPIYNMLIYPDMVLEDLVGPMTVFKLTMGETRLVGKNRLPVPTDVGIPLTAIYDFADCPRDGHVLFVPGGLKGTAAVMEDHETISFLQDMSGNVDYVSSVCTGSLILGAAGLLRGRHATSHWYVRNLLPILGAKPVDERVVEDGPVITGAGITAGLDFALTLAARIKGEDWVRKMMLTLEYDPQPPFSGGTPARADKSHVEAVLARRQPGILAAEQAARKAAGRF